MASHAWRPRPARPAIAGRRAARSRPRWSVLSTALSAIAGLAITLVGAAPAQAEPSVTEIEKQIDVAWNKLEPVIEQHNAARQELGAKRKQADALAKKIAPLQAEVDRVTGKIGGLAANAYKGDQASVVNALLTTGSPTGLMDGLEILDQYSRNRQREVRAAVELKHKYEEQKAPLDLLIAQLAKSEAELGAKAKEINAEVDRLQKLRIQAYGNGGGGVFRPAPCPAVYPGGDSGKVVKFACAQIGKPYYWGSDGPSSYDCSGLMLRAWAQVGVSLPHNAAQQYNRTKRVSRSQLQPGDMVFYSGLSHVGMYVGGGWIVHAPQSGDHVRMKRVDDGSIVGYGRP
ncbi:NlpC/P60 family protein [Plantactinospora sp. GCM10030261]|uniref:C40 family peptidase n=1 Tax=Plantactinospora sp. GCM10030261 TaxID=3273420 RepID=UPI0036231584